MEILQKQPPVGVLTTEIGYPRLQAINLRTANQVKHMVLYRLTPCFVGLKPNGQNGQTKFGRFCLENGEN